ncbi:unnamed protein product [Phytomonas sp. Hart1]|nr:unnamed protein product [Phytomonas sp. Hart1]|eukprot:CCW68663.1 unnamed protein product [Phytomonas sp. isolate Hart1]
MHPQRCISRTLAPFCIFLSKWNCVPPSSILRSAHRRKSDASVLYRDSEHGSRWWCEIPSVEKLQRIDVLTYHLGRYPHARRRNSVKRSLENNDTNACVSKTSNLTQGRDPYLLTSALPPPCSLPNELREMDDAIVQSRNPKARTLETLQWPLRHPAASRTPVLTSARKAIVESNLPMLLRFPSSTLASSSVPPIPVSRSVRFGVNAEPVEDVDSIHPFTPIEKVHAIHKAWRHCRRKRLYQEELLTTDTTAIWSDLLSLSKSPFWDEKAVLFRFGMGACAAPDGVPGFDGLFRQHWKDFSVTEMEVDIACRCGGRPLSRDYSFTIPPLPLCVANQDNLNKKHDVQPETSKSDVLFGMTIDEEHDANRNAPQVHENALQVEKYSTNANTGVVNVADTRLDHDKVSFFHVDVATSIEAQRCEALGYLKHKPQLQCVGHRVCEEEERFCLPRKGEIDHGSALSDNTIALTVHDELNFEKRKKELDRLEELETVLHRREQQRSVVRKKLLLPNADGSLPNLDWESKPSMSHHYLECTLHKQHVAHSTALSAIAQVLRVHPRTISVAGIKDYIGDTVQRVRVKGISPHSALQANRIFRRKGLNITLSDFSYKTTPLRSGELFGNHFQILLRDVKASKSVIQDAVNAFVTHGFPNYYGCQRFSWFAGKEDAAFALLRHNWLGFAFCFLNYTTTSRTLRQLLQREKKYPNPIMDEYRRNVVRRLRQNAIEPKDLDEEPFLSTPSLSEPQMINSAGESLNQKQQLIIFQLREAYFDLHLQSRRLTAQRLSSYLWNQVLTLRLQHFPADEVLDGDFVMPALYRNASSNTWDRVECVQKHSDVVDAMNHHLYSINDVVHPGFSFEGISLPENAIGLYYAHICDRYHLDWNAKHSKSGLQDFREPPRPIIRHPIELSFTHDIEARTLRLEFALERGCYANVAITELMKQARCVGAENLTLLPAPEDLWDRLGERDPGYVTSLQDIYPDFDDGLGTVHDTVTIPFEAGTETKVWDLPGPLFLPSNQDPYRKAHQWGSQHLLRNMQRRVVEAENMKRRLFEKSLARKLAEGEIAQYAGHTVPMLPNAPSKRLFFKILRRNQRYAGAPKMTSRFARMTQPQNRRKALPAFKTLNRDSWNVTW